MTRDPLGLAFEKQFLEADALTVGYSSERCIEVAFDATEGMLVLLASDSRFYSSASSKSCASSMSSSMSLSSSSSLPNSSTATSNSCIGSA